MKFIEMKKQFGDFFNELKKKGLVTKYSFTPDQFIGYAAVYTKKNMYIVRYSECMLSPFDINGTFYSSIELEQYFIQGDELKSNFDQTILNLQKEDLIQITGGDEWLTKVTTINNETLTIFFRQSTKMFSIHEKQLQVSEEQLREHLTT